MLSCWEAIRGGVGKTTLAVNLAVFFTTKGFRVTVIKADKNAELAEWQQRRERSELPRFAIREALGNISNEIRKFKTLSDIVLVDTAGHDSVEFRSAISVADIFLSPVRPSSQAEVDTLAAMTNIVRKAQELSNPQLRAFIILDRCKTHHGNTDASELTQSLQSSPVWIQPCRTRIAQLAIFENAFNEGKAVHDLYSGSSVGKAKAQIELLATELGLN